MRQTCSIAAGIGAILALRLALPYRVLAGSLAVEGAKFDLGITWYLVIFVVVAVLFVVIALPTILKWQQSRRHKVLHIEIANQGNVKSHYALHVSELSGTLDFEFRVDGVSLHEHSPTSSFATPQLAPLETPGKVPGARGSTAQTAQAGGTLVGFLTALGSILPSSLGQSVTRFSNNIRRGQAFASRAQRTLNYGEQLRADRVAVSAESRSVEPASAAVSPSHGSLMGHTWIQTASVGPGELLLLDLSVNPQYPYKTRCYSLILKSRSVELQNTPQVVQKCDVEIVGLNAFELWIPFFIPVFVAGALVFLVAQLFS